MILFLFSELKGLYFPLSAGICVFKGNDILYLLILHMIVRKWPLLGLGEKKIRRGVVMGLEGGK